MARAPDAPSSRLESESDMLALPGLLPLIPPLGVALLIVALARRRTPARRAVLVLYR
jgi:hypothetical protein